MAGSTRDRILVAAGGLFAVNTYSAVSVRDIAAKAGVSPALVIKLVGRKEDVFRESISLEPLPHVREAAREDLGRVLVTDVVQRRDSELPDPLARAMLLMPSPDPEEVRRMVRETYVQPLAERLGGPTAEIVIAMLAGLSVSLRLYHGLDEATISSADLIARYGALVQGVIDQGVIDQGALGQGVIDQA